MRRLFLIAALILPFGLIAKVPQPVSVIDIPAPLVLTHLYVRLHPTCVSSAIAERVAQRAGLQYGGGSYELNLYKILVNANDIDELKQHKSTLLLDPYVQDVIVDYQVND